MSFAWLNGWTWIYILAAGNVQLTISGSNNYFLKIDHTILLLSRPTNSIYTARHIIV
jgi:hypothetical protein